MSKYTPLSGKKQQHDNPRRFQWLLGRVASEVQAIRKHREEIDDCERHLDELIWENRHLITPENVSSIYWSYEKLAGAIKDAFKEVHGHYPEIKPTDLPADCCDCDFSGCVRGIKSWAKYRQEEKSAHRCPSCLAAWKHYEDQKRLTEAAKNSEDNVNRSIEKQKAINTLKRLSYREYLQSPHWKKVRHEALRHANYQCQLCSRKGGCILQVHHKHYKTLGEESYRDDLIVLCRPCHERHHGVLAERGIEQ